jgi:hypothetical protein
LADVTTLDAAHDDGALSTDAGRPGDGPETRQSVDELFARLRAEAGTIGTLDEVDDPEGIDTSRDTATLLEVDEVVVTVTPSSGSSSDTARAEEGFSDEATEGVRILSATPAAAKAPSPKAASPKAPPASAGSTPAGARDKAGADRGDKPGPSPSSAALGRSGVVRSDDTPSSPSPSSSSSASSVDDGAEGAGDVGADPLVVQRDEVLTPLVVALARRLKRALQDDQNDVLDRLRAKGGWAPGVLPPEDDHARRYAEAVADQLLEAARAGATFAGGKADEAPGVDDVAASMAAEIVAPLRRRLEGAGPSVEEGDESALVELVGAAYREWKGARTERLAGDQTLFAFARAALAAVPEGTMLRWVVNDDVAECPDCDDNALAGPVPSRQDYPTGHPHPPAHAGCRCLLVAANA